MMMLAGDARDFRLRKERERRFAAARAALQLACRVDLESAIAAPGPARRLMRVRLGRLIEKERLKGATRHWSYDLNRHIALKQARDLLSQGRDVTNGECEARTEKRTAPQGRRSRRVVA